MKKRMSAYRSHINWHDLRIDPCDLPEDHEEILVTTENTDCVRRVRTDIYLKQLDGRLHYAWVEKVMDPETNKVEETMIWEKVVAWAYLPGPYIV